jgi:hypothetical protein
MYNEVAKEAEHLDPGVWKDCVGYGYRDSESPDQHWYTDGGEHKCR